jgi:hypothetical protein
MKQYINNLYNNLFTKCFQPNQTIWFLSSITIIITIIIIIIT